MSPSRRSFVLGAAAATAAAPARAQKHAGDAHRHHSGAHQNSFATEMHEQMRIMTEVMDRAPITGDPDCDFLRMMIPHHQGAVDMARLVLVHGQDPLTRQLAEEIIASQQAEISSMKGRLQVLERRSARDVESFPALTGTRGRGSQ
jgi:uncharacterized protein (DUF305 family)